MITQMGLAMKGKLKIRIAELMEDGEAQELLSVEADASLLEEKKIFIASSEDEEIYTRYSIIRSRIEASKKGTGATLFVKPYKESFSTRVLTWLDALDGDTRHYVSMGFFFIPFSILIALLVSIVVAPLELLGLLIRYSGWAAAFSVVVLFIWLGLKQKFEVISGALFIGSLTVGAISGLLVAIFWSSYFGIHFGEMDNVAIGNSILAQKSGFIGLLAPYAPTVVLFLNWLKLPLVAGLVKENIKIKKAE